MKLNERNWAIMNMRTFLNIFNSVVLMLHIIFLLTFASVGATLLAYVNIASVTFYLLSYIAIRRKNYFTYIITACLEILIHSVLVILFLGWGIGFQVYCFLVIPILFFSVYMAYSNPKELAIPIIGSVVDIAAYVFCFFYTGAHEPIYAGLLSEASVRNFYFINTLIVFPSLIIQVGFFMINAIHSELVLQHMAKKDELTGLKNRRFILEALDLLYSEASTGGKRFALAISDIDDFKKVNDSFGHDAGDFVLKSMGSRIKRCMPKNARAGRWGGEEFIYIFTDEANAAEAMESVRRSIEGEPFVYEGRKIAATITVGLAEYEEGASIADIIRKADAGLYEGKAKGKNVLVSK